MNPILFLIKILFYFALWQLLDDQEGPAIVVFSVIYIFQIVHLARESVRRHNGHYSVINFNVLFFIMYTLCTYIIPLFHLLGIDAYDLFLPIQFKDSYIPQSLFLSSVAVEAYSSGYLKGLTKTRLTVKTVSLSALRRAIFISSIMSLLTTLFFLFDFLRSRNAGLKDVGGQTAVLVTCFAILPIILCGYANKYYKLSLIKFISKNWFPFSCILFISLSMLSIGDRLITVCLLSATVFIINEFVHKIKTPVFVVAVVIGFFLMFLISLTRGSGMTIGEGYSSYQSSGENMLVFQDVYPANATYLLGVELKETQGLYKPLRIIPYALNPIPFVPRWLKNTFFGGEIASAMYLTVHNRNNVRIGDTGLGTHIVGDIFISWGIVGVIALFALLGYLVGLCYIRRDNIYYLIAYSGLISWALFMPRESVFDPYRNVVWMLAFTAIVLSSISSHKSVSNNRTV